MASSYDYDAPLDEYGTKPNSKTYNKYVLMIS